MQVVLNDKGSWTDMASQSKAMLEDHSRRSGDPAASKPAGMLGFLSRKKGRDRSPKASSKPKERGVLGKEGARHVISQG